MRHENKLIVASFFKPNIPNSVLRRCVARQLEISVSFFRHVDWRRSKAKTAKIAQSSMHESVAHLRRGFMPLSYVFLKAGVEHVAGEPSESLSY